jgi:hypothetical protein
MAALSKGLADRLDSWAGRLRGGDRAPDDSAGGEVPSPEPVAPGAVEEAGGPPAHWLQRVQSAGPPPHWVEYVQSRLGESPPVFAGSSPDDLPAAGDKAMTGDDSQLRDPQPEIAGMDAARTPDYSGEEAAGAREDTPGRAVSSRPAAPSSGESLQGPRPVRSAIIAPVLASSARSWRAGQLKPAEAPERHSAAVGAQAPGSGDVEIGQAARTGAPIRPPRAIMPPKVERDAASEPAGQVRLDTQRRSESVGTPPAFAPPVPAHGSTAPVNTEYRVPSPGTRYSVLGTRYSPVQGGPERDLGPQGTLPVTTTAGTRWPELPPPGEWDEANRGGSEAEAVWRERERLRRLAEEQRGL